MPDTETYTPEYLRLYERPDSYWGPDYLGCYRVYTVSRNSGPQRQSNWEALERDFGNSPGVFIRRANHWLCGWIDEMYVDPNEASAETLRELDEIVAALKIPELER